MLYESLDTGLFADRWQFALEGLNYVVVGSCSAVEPVDHVLRL